MTKSFLTATALAALLGFSATAAVAQQSAPLEAPSIQKSAPAESGKADSGTLQNKSRSGGTLHQGAAAPSDNKAKRNTADRAADRKAKREAAAACASIKDKAAHEACVTDHVKNQSAKVPGTKGDLKATTPDKGKVSPRTGG
jgi:hypothetical protein